MAKIIVIDGMDGSGKFTQAQLLKQYLVDSGVAANKILQISFPRYTNKSATLVESYLNGEINSDAMNVNPYAASMMFALDRYISYEQDWKDFTGDYILFDRYTTSNVLHQTPKLNPEDQLGFAEWVYDTEYNLFKLPKPDIEFYLSVPANTSIELIDHRNNNKDIHENLEFQNTCRECFNNIVYKAMPDINIINCTDKDGKMFAKEEISAAIIELLKVSNIII